MVFGGVFTMLDYSKPNIEATKVPAPGFVPTLEPVACLTAWNTAAFRASDEIAESWLKFVGERLAKGADFPRKVKNCENADDLIVLYGEYLQQTANDYAAEFSKIFNTAWAAGKTVWGFAPNASSEVQSSSSRN
jgi:hypothetical protein